jgi:D-alanyl-D-alanine dipeptidase
LRTALALAISLAAARAAAEPAMPASFVYLRDIDPSIVQDMRYAGADNFVGRPLAGYAAAECVLRRPAAEALRRVQADLAGTGHALKVYDCYRPDRAVRDMARWAQAPSGGERTRRFYPRLQRGALFRLGYISSQSRHSNGMSVDLTMIEASAAPAPAFDPAASYGPCTGPAAARAPDNSLDMGTGYDCFDVNSHTRSAAVDAEQRRRRLALVAAMATHGFRNYFREWWHFDFSGAASGPRYDFPIRPRPAPRP